MTNKLITVLALNPAIDQTLEVSGFQLGATNRLTSSRLDPGGKGTNVARVLHELGADVQVLGFLGSGNGAQFTRTLSDLEIRHQFIAILGENRINLKIIEPETGRLTEINDAGFSVVPDDLERLTGLVEAAMPQTGLLVLSGSLPEGLPPTYYHDLIGLAATHGVPTIVDTDDQPLVHALRARPTLIKPNRAEAERLVGRRLTSHTEIVAAAVELLERGPQMVIISNGRSGAVLVSTEGRWWATPPTIQPGSTVGAGDSMVAGFALGLSRALPGHEALRLATAAGAATASLKGTQLCSESDLLRLLPQVTVTAI
jgi:1-phosphofructokinase